MQFDFSTLDAKQRYKLLGSTITPRPIAWVSTLGANGSPNAAPFSFFNVFGEDPPIVAFAIVVTAILVSKRRSTSIAGGDTTTEAPADKVAA